MPTAILIIELIATVLIIIAFLISCAALSGGPRPPNDGGVHH